MLIFKNPGRLIPVGLLKGLKARLGREHQVTIVVFFLVFLFSIVIFANAWVCDDAYITFRTLDNLFHGYGLTWNIAERVQAYSHPLWMLIMAASSYFSRDFYYTSILLGAIFTLAAFLILVLKIAKSLGAGIIGACLLSSSKAFVDYSTSGLENSLTYFILSVFFLIYFLSTWNYKTLFLLTLTATLGILNRMDTALLFFFPLAGVIWQMLKNREWKIFSIVLLGLMPFLIWEMFSLVYYGFPFPNTAYAKIATGIPQADLIKQCGYYLLNSLSRDPITLLVIGLGILLPLVVKEKKTWPVVLGILVYMAYLFKIGGDFMSGRFLTAPFFCAVIMLVRLLSFSVKTGITALGMIILLAFCSPHNFDRLMNNRRYKKSLFDGHGICDERGYYYPLLGLRRVFAGQNYAAYPPHPFHLYINQGKQCRREAVPVIVHNSVGLLGYHAGPWVHIIDQYALCDPLLARLPALTGGQRIGHFKRKIPGGYMESLRTKKDCLTDRQLAVYYKKLKNITQGKIFRWVRLKDIIKMNLGYYGVLIDQAYYCQPLGPRRLAEISEQDKYADFLHEGNWAYKMVQYRRAEEQWHQALNLEPDRLEARANLGIMYEKMGEYNNALQAYALTATHKKPPWNSYYQELLSNIHREAHQEHGALP
ncbi:hypothetical protein KAR10_06240 [bacterium]|nr:hypothetical protein [bacterium]